jgi:hypothetical protein
MRAPFPSDLELAWKNIRKDFLGVHMMIIYDVASV